MRRSVAVDRRAGRRRRSQAASVSPEVIAALKASAVDGRWRRRSSSAVRERASVRSPGSWRRSPRPAARRRGACGTTSACSTSTSGRSVRRTPSSWRRSSSATSGCAFRRGPVRGVRPRRDGDGEVTIDGPTTFGSGCRYGEWTGVAFAMVDPEPASRPSHPICASRSCASTTPGVRIEPTWDGMALRASATDTVHHDRHAGAARPRACRGTPRTAADVLRRPDHPSSTPATARTGSGCRTCGWRPRPRAPPAPPSRRLRPASSGDGRSWARR